MPTNPKRPSRITARSLAAAAACATLAACMDYTVETTVRPDGSGVREIRVEATDPPESMERRREFVALAHLTPEEGWEAGHEVQADGDTVFTFHKRMVVPDLDGWSFVSGSLTMDGTRPALADEQVGYVRLGDVRYRNEVRVGRGRTSDGTTTITYRETFRWDRAVDVIVELFVVAVDREFAERYPRLTAGERGQIAGAFRTRFWMMVDAGIFEDDADEEELTREAVRGTAEQAVRVVKARYPDTSVSELETLLQEVMEGDPITDAFSRLTPGVDLALNTHVVFRLRLPGEVTSSNADREEDGVLVWEFGPDDALLAPVRIQAESVLAR